MKSNICIFVWSVVNDMKGIESCIVYLQKNHEKAIDLCVSLRMTLVFCTWGERSGLHKDSYQLS